MLQDKTLTQDSQEADTVAMTNALAIYPPKPATHRMTKAMDSTVTSNRKMELAETKSKLREIFEYYASFGDRLNKKLLYNGKFFKILVDANLSLTGHVDSLENRKSSDIVFSQVNSNKSHMPFEIFLHSLIRMGEMKYPHYGAGDALKAVVNGYMLPLYDKIMNKT